jgi:hypothetical protein
MSSVPLTDQRVAVPKFRIARRAASRRSAWGTTPPGFADSISESSDANDRRPCADPSSTGPTVSAFGSTMILGAGVRKEEHTITLAWI